MTRIKSLRRDEGLTQQDIATMLGITRGAYANIENGKREPDIATMFFLANHFNVSVDYLLGRTDEKEPTVKDDGLHADPPDLETEDGRIKEFIHLFRQLTDSERSLIVAQIKGILAEQRKTPEA